MIPVNCGTYFLKKNEEGAERSAARQLGSSALIGGANIVSLNQPAPANLELDSSCVRAPV